MLGVPQGLFLCKASLSLGTRMSVRVLHRPTRNWDHTDGEGDWEKDLELKGCWVMEKAAWAGEDR